MEVSIFDDSINGKTVGQRVELALRYVLSERWDTTRGGTTIDVQGEDYQARIWMKSLIVCGVYNNAMLAIAIEDLQALIGSQP